jgi:hypothetical protein
MRVAIPGPPSNLQTARRAFLSAGVSAIMKFPRLEGLAIE